MQIQVLEGQSEEESYCLGTVAHKVVAVVPDNGESIFDAWFGEGGGNGASDDPAHLSPATRRERQVFRRLAAAVDGVHLRHVIYRELAESQSCSAATDRVHVPRLYRVLFSAGVPDGACWRMRDQVKERGGVSTEAPRPGLPSASRDFVAARRGQRVLPEHPRDEIRSINVALPSPSPTTDQ